MNDLKPLLEQLTGAVTRIADCMESSVAAKPGASAPSLGLSPDLQSALPDSPITALLSDESISDILVNGPFEIYISRGGKMQKTDLQFTNHESLFELAEYITHTMGRRIDPKRPLVDARLRDGSRVNIIAPPMAVSGLALSIRKFPKHEITLEKLVEHGSMTTQMAHFLKLCGQFPINLLVSGGTGTGKTTLLNAISRSIPHDERIITIEDTAELNLQQPHVVRLETKQPTTMGDRSEEVSTSDLLHNALRMRPDRIIIGEVRGSEAYDMIQAMNTGHDGSMATIHANTPRDAITRLENMLSPTMPTTPVANIRRQIVSALNIIIQATRGQDGVRRVSSIADIIGMEGDTPTIQPIFSLRETVSKTGEVTYMQEWSNIMPRHSQLAALARSEGVFNHR